MTHKIDFLKIITGRCKFMKLLGALLYSCKFVHLFILEFMVHVLPALQYTLKITFDGRFECIGRMPCACFKLILLNKLDTAIENVGRCLPARSIFIIILNT